jgi:arabinose-5-phosphate isomerase
MSPLVALAQQELSDADLAVARRVLRVEADGLLALAESVDDSFVAACAILAGVRGRVIITGMGKSGHIARKIAATFASTGTPAQYVHPGEASHGDLGMIREGDAVLAMSNSGETTELADVIEYTRRFHIPLIAITGNPTSTLAKHADVVLILPPVPEAAADVLAPTTSTTMNLALGDALAVALLERRGFDAEDFRRFHPGGKLGRRLLKVADLMHGAEELPLAAPGDSMAVTVLRMTEKRFGVIGVADAAGVLIGVITDGDLRRHMRPDLLERKAGDVMTGKPVTTTGDALAAEVLGVMNERRISSLFVVGSGDRPIGIIHIHDLLRAGVA